MLSDAGRALLARAAAMLAPPPLTRPRILDLVDAVEASDMAGPDRRAVISILRAVATSKQAAAAIAPKGSAGAKQAVEKAKGEQRRQIHIALWTRLDSDGDRSLLSTHRKVTDLFKDYRSRQWESQRSRETAPPAGITGCDDLFWRLMRLSSCYQICTYNSFASLIKKHRTGGLKSKRKT